MLKCFFTCLILIFTCFFSFVYGLNRDYYVFNLDQGGFLEYSEINELDSNDDYSDLYDYIYCFEHFSSYYDSPYYKAKLLLPYQGEKLLNLIPPFAYHWLAPLRENNICHYRNAKSRLECKNQYVYPGYLDIDFRVYNSFIEEQLEFYNENSVCDCYWPELSQEAGMLSDFAYHLFADLFEHTVLSKLIDNYDKQDRLFHNLYWNLNLHGLCVSSVCRSFWFSHYYRVCLQILNFANEEYQAGEISQAGLCQVQAKLYELLCKLAQPFGKMYVCCNEDHYSQKINEELHFLRSIYPSLCHFETQDAAQINAFNIFHSRENKEKKFHDRSLGVLNPYPKELESINNANQNNPHRFLSEYYLYQGLYNNDVLQFSKAIELFDKALKFDNQNRLTYLARAYANFEIQNFDEALKDYGIAQSLQITPPLLPGCLYEFSLMQSRSNLNRIEFAKGFALGGMEGFNEGAKTFIPSTLNTITGIAQGLWLFSKDPVTISCEFVETVGSYILLIENYVHDKELREDIASEVTKVLDQWFSVSDFEKGRQIGHVIGKYGVDILCLGSGIQLIRKSREFKYRNGELTLRAFEQQKNRQIILEKARNQAKARKTLFKNGLIKISWSDQNKHFRDAHNFINGRSYFTILREKLQKLVEASAGTGRAIEGRKIGEVGYKEVVDFQEIIGVYIKQDIKGNVVVEKPTRFGTIHYKKDGSLHVIPANPNQF